MKIKMNEGIKQALLKSINVGEVFSEGVLYKLTQSIIDDDYENLDSRSDVEIIDMFEDDYNMTNYLEWSPDRKDLFLETQAKAWGLKTLEFSIDDWVAHFTDYIEHEDGALEEYEAFLDKIDKVTKIELSSRQKDKITNKRKEENIMKNLLLKNMELEKEFKEINLDGVGEFVKEMMLDLQWDLFTAVQEGEAEYISVYQMSLIESSNEYATMLLENKEQLIEALSKAETAFIEDMNKRDVEINEYAIKDNSLEYLPLSIEFFEDMIVKSLTKYSG